MNHREVRGTSLKAGRLEISEQPAFSAMSAESPFYAKDKLHVLRRQTSMRNDAILPRKRRPLRRPSWHYVVVHPQQIDAPHRRVLSSRIKPNTTIRGG